MIVKIPTISLKDYPDPAERYATLVALNRKPLETRTWKTDYRGDLLIHCSMSSAGFNAGKALCIVNLVDITRFVKSMEKDACCQVYPGAYAWHFRDLRVLVNPFGKKGQLSIYDTLIDEAFLACEPVDEAKHVPLLDPRHEVVPAPLWSPAAIGLDERKPIAPQLDLFLPPTTKLKRSPDFKFPDK